MAAIRLSCSGFAKEANEEPGKLKLAPAVKKVRGFMYAGAARVVASLWKADDEATRHLMEAFYRQMLIEKRPSPAALQAAQLYMSRNPEWRDPFYWAGFVLEGEWMAQ